MKIKINGNVVSETNDCIKELVSFENIIKENYYLSEEQQKEVRSRIPQVFSPIFAVLLTQFKNATVFASNDLNSVIAEAQNKIGNIAGDSSMRWAEVYNKDKGGWLSASELPDYARHHMYGMEWYEMINWQNVMSLVFIIITIFLAYVYWKNDTKQKVN